jgi:hypothetical protein
MPFEGLHPETERGGHTERIGASGETDDGALVAIQQLGREPGLAHPRIGEEEHAAELAGEGASKLSLELGEFPSPAY